MQGGALPHALNALVLGFVLRLRQHRRQALGGSFRQGPWCSHAKPPASASLPLFMIVRKRISIIAGGFPQAIEAVYPQTTTLLTSAIRTVPLGHGTAFTGASGS